MQRMVCQIINTEWSLVLTLHNFLQLIYQLDGTLLIIRKLLLTRELLLIMTIINKWLNRHFEIQCTYVLFLVNWILLFSEIAYHFQIVISFHHYTILTNLFLTIWIIWTIQHNEIITYSMSNTAFSNGKYVLASPLLDSDSICIL